MFKGSTLGLRYFNEHHLFALQQYRVKKILIAFDNDREGNRAARQISQLVSAYDIECCRIHYPREKDANDCLLFCRQFKPYLKYLRPKLATFESGGALFLNINGQRIKVKKLTEMVGRYVSRSGTNAMGVCHVFRHAAATHMLRNGADIRYVQELLGHADISCTQIYAQVTMNDLSRVYKRNAPGSKIK